MSLAVLVAYDMYLEMEEGELNQTWKEGNIVDFWTFCDLLSNQILKYNPIHRKYASGDSMRPATHKNQSTRYIIQYDSRVKIGKLLA